MFLISFTSSVELVGPELKTFWGNLIHVPFQIGGLIVTLIAYLERDWVMFQVSLQYVLLKFDEINAIFLSSDLLFHPNLPCPPSLLHNTRVPAVADCKGEEWGGGSSHKKSGKNEQGHHHEDFFKMISWMYMSTFNHDPLFQNHVPEHLLLIKGKPI